MSRHLLLRSSSKWRWLELTIVCDRQKVDLTKFIESHNFTFDNVFDLHANNQEVSLFPNPNNMEIQIYQKCV